MKPVFLSSTISAFYIGIGVRLPIVVARAGLRLALWLWPVAGAVVGLWLALQLALWLALRLALWLAL